MEEFTRALSNPHLTHRRRAFFSERTKKQKSLRALLLIEQLGLNLGVLRPFVISDRKLAHS